MKMLPAGTEKKMPAFAHLSGYKGLTQPVYSDSLEVTEQFYCEKLQVLKVALERLNVLENSREIAFLCREVTRTRKALQDISKRKNNRNT